MAGPLRNEYIQRINNTLDYIEQNMDRSFTLDELAGVANFSKYHFNRIFCSLVGETPFGFINRVRIERAGTLLLSPGFKTITDVAFKVGFTDQSVFSRYFKSHFKLSPTQYRAQKNHNSNIGQMNSNHGKIIAEPSGYFCSRTHTYKWKNTMELNKSIEIKNLPKMNLAYIRHTGPYQGNENLFEGLWNRLFTWAGPRNLIGGPDFKSLIIYHDDPNITDENKLRMSVCITVPDGTKTDGEVGNMELEPAKCVVARFDVDASQFGQAWQWLYGQWFPQSGYQPDDKPCFEMYPEEPKDGRFIVDICVPVKPL
jgi:AraC family transcriptional regulator